MRTDEGTVTTAATQVSANLVNVDNNKIKSNMVPNQDEMSKQKQPPTLMTSGHVSGHQNDLSSDALAVSTRAKTQETTGLSRRSVSESLPEIIGYGEQSARPKSVQFGHGDHQGRQYGDHEQSTRPKAVQFGQSDHQGQYGEHEQSTRPKAVQFGHGIAELQGNFTQPRGSLDSAFASPFFQQPKQQPSPRRRKLQYSASWPTANNNDKVGTQASFPHGASQTYDQSFYQQTPESTGLSGDRASRASFPHGDHQKEEYGQCLYQQTPNMTRSRDSRQRPKHLELSQSSSERPDVTSPTQELVQSLHRTRLQSPPSYEQFVNQSGAETLHMPTSQTLSNPNTYRGTTDSISPLASTQSLSPRPLVTEEQHLQTQAHFGCDQSSSYSEQARATSGTYSNPNPHGPIVSSERRFLLSPQNDAATGESYSNPNVAQGASTDRQFIPPPPGEATGESYSNQDVAQGVSTHRRFIPSSQRNQRSSWHGMRSAISYPHHQFRRGVPISTYNPYQRAILAAFPHSSSSVVRGHDPLSVRHLHPTWASIRHARRQSPPGLRTGFPTHATMLQVLNQTPNWPIPQQTNQSTDFTTELSFLDEPWGPTPTTLPSIASAFIPRASSPGQFSTASSTTRSEASEWMDLDAPAPSPNPSDISDAPSFEDLSEIIFDDVRRDIFDVCQEINISPDPSQWSIEEVDRWIKRSNAHYNLQPINMDFFHMDGVSLCNLTEDDFGQRAPRGGDVIFHNLEIWKNFAAQPFQRPQPAPAPQPMQEQEAFFLPNTFPIPQFPVPQEIPTPNFTYNIKMEPLDHDVETASIASGSSSDDQSLPSPTATGSSGPDTSMTPNHTGSIHLWQFLKELLLQPDSYGYCIRWLDRSQGIFKIEDSVKVANLWGRRKNRPAMNYDKMSRSIRQYYKKGIMKKTEVSQRLVYQFVNPC